MLRFLIAACIFAFSSPVLAQPHPAVGAVTDISIRYETESRTVRDDHMLGPSSSSSSGSYSYVERVLEVGDAGVALEYALPEREGERPLVEWEFPVRALRAPDGTLSITNREEMLARRDRFLRKAEIPKEACGSYYFTWNFFQINCDPEAVLETVANLHLQVDELAEGAMYSHDSALQSAPLELVSESPDGSRIYTASMILDGDAILSERAEAARIIAEMMRQSGGPELPEENFADDRGEGRLTVVLEGDADGQVYTRRELIELTHDDGEGSIERETREQVYERVRRH